MFVDCTVTMLRDDIIVHPEYTMSLNYDYGGGKLRFWRVSRDSLSALDGVGNRVSFRLDSSYQFKAERFSMSPEYAMCNKRVTF